MKKEIGIIAIAVFLMIQSVSAITPIGNITTIQGFPNVIIAGSEYELHYQFDNTNPISITILFNITNQQVPVNYNDFSVNISLNNEELNCSEIDEGIFKCNEYTIITSRTNDLKVSFTSKINLQPAENYTFQLSGMIRYEEEKKVIEEKIYFEGGGGGGGNLQRDTDRDGICDWFEEIRGSDPNNPCDPDSECAACLKLKQSVWYNETPIIETRIIPTQIPTSTPTPEAPILVVKEPFQWKFIAIPIGIVIAVILFLVWRGREYEEEEYEYENEYSYYEEE